eukprot:gene29912-51977_t
MCGIVGAVSTRNIVPVLVQGLERLEYRGYDSCGVAVYAQDGQPGLRRARSTPCAARVRLLAHEPVPQRRRHGRRAQGPGRRADRQAAQRIGSRLA